jgi:maleate cis-trans isomerase
MEAIHIDPGAATDRLAAELADVRASIELVSSGVASGVTLTGLRFSRQIAERLAETAGRAGVDLLTQPWADDSGGDVRVQVRAGEAPAHPHG